MRNRRRVVAPLLLAGALGACEPETPEGTATPPAAEEAPLPDRPEVEGYDPESLAWFRDGRPVVFQTQSWRPIGQPLPAPPEAFERVGEFEGMALYAAAEDSPPYDTLFFPLGNDLWQPLEPADSVISERSP
ncbi:MAG TPA: hypothetical protein VF212_10585 [Longimicrobiales bacterium]